VVGIGGAGNCLLGIGLLVVRSLGGFGVVCWWYWRKGGLEDRGRWLHDWGAGAAGGTLGGVTAGIEGGGTLGSGVGAGAGWTALSGGKSGELVVLWEF
jgi:hypothetical protein